MIKLNDYRRKVYSQTGEDGILEMLFQSLGIKNGNFCEFGASDGMSYCNTRKLREEGWEGVLIEGDPEYLERLRENLKEYKNIEILNEFISCEQGSTLDEILSRTKLKADFDFISIDIDGNDIWVWESMEKYSPKVVMVEYNPNYDSNSSLSIKYDKDHRHQLDSYYSATAGAYKKLADKKGYKLVGFTDGLNLVFCKNELASNFYEYKLDEIQLMRVWPHKDGRELFSY
jgi:hypothetical protein